MNTIERKVLFYKVVAPFLFILILIMLFASKNVLSNMRVLVNITSLIGWLVLAWIIASWNYFRNEIICPYLVFLTVAFFFMYGQCLLIPFNLLQEGASLLDIFDIESFLIAQIYTLLCFIAFHLSALCTQKANRSQLRSTETIRNLYMAIEVVGWFLYFLSIVPMLLVLKKDYSLVSNYGYRGLFVYKSVFSGLGAIVYNLSQYYVPSLICLFVSSLHSKILRTFIVTNFLIYSAILLYIGRRGAAVTSLLILVCMINFTKSKFSYKRIITYGIVGYFGISFLQVIYATRNQIDKSFTMYIQYISNNSHFFSSTITEIGGSMFPLIYSMKLIPSSQPFRYGSSYLLSISSIIPNMGFWKVHPAQVYGNLGLWLQNTLRLNYSPGFSLVAELYVNFGWLGCLFVLFLGILIGKTLSMVTGKNARIYPERFIFELIIINLSLLMVRNSFQRIVRAYFYFAIPIYLLIYLTQYFIKKYH